MFERWKAHRTAKRRGFRGKRLEHWFGGSQVNEGELRALYTGTLPKASDTSDRYKTHVYVVVGDLGCAGGARTEHPDEW